MFALCSAAVLAVFFWGFNTRIASQKTLDRFLGILTGLVVNWGSLKNLLFLDVRATGLF